MIYEGTKLLLIDHGGRRYPITAAKRMIEVAGLGVIDGNALCNSSYGDSLQIGGRELLILKPSVKDAIAMIERRAQIIIPKDSFMIPLQLDIGPGSRVIEGGVGSGALTLVLLKAVGPTGRVYSYESRQDYADLARKNVALSDNESSWELKVGDICTAKLESEVDAAVLDIPNPWDAMANVTGSLRVGGYVCCYVPNANQLETAVKKMREVGLAEIVSFETLQREMVVHDGGVRPSFDMLGHTGYLSFGRRMHR
jgi:tRNA (adenine57-N1/adenine58-N1)-methyltransferase